VKKKYFDHIDNFILDIKENLKYLNNSYNNVEEKKAISEIESKKIDLYLNQGKILDFSFPIELKKKKIKEIIQKNLSKLTICITEDCNLRCDYCVYSESYPLERNYSNKSINFYKAKKAIDFFFSTTKSEKELTIDFFGGEPLLEFDLIKNIIEYSNTLGKDNKIAFSIITNGTIMDNDIIDYLIKNNVYLYISLDGPKEIHDRFRKTKDCLPTYSKIMKNLKSIRNKSSEFYQQNVIFQITVGFPNDLLSIKQFYSTNSLVKNNFFILNFVNRINTTFFIDKNIRIYKSNDAEILLNDFLEDVIEGRQKKNNFSFQLYNSYFKEIHSRKGMLPNGTLYPNGICIPGYSKVFIDVNGYIRICEKAEGFMDIGNIYTGFDFDKIIHLIKKYVSFCNEDCKRCWLKWICNYCFIHAKGKNELTIEERRKYCNEKKEIYKKYFVLYAYILEKNKKAFHYLEDIPGYSE
jgi:uncharacterized protein